MQEVWVLKPTRPIVEDGYQVRSCVPSHYYFSGTRSLFFLTCQRIIQRNISEAKYILQRTEQIESVKKYLASQDLNNQTPRKRKRTENQVTLCAAGVTWQDLQMNVERGDFEEIMAKPDFSLLRSLGLQDVRQFGVVECEPSAVMLQRMEEGLRKFNQLKQRTKDANVMHNRCLRESIKCFSDAHLLVLFSYLTSNLERCFNLCTSMTSRKLLRLSRLYRSF